MTNGILLTRHNQEIAQWSPDPFPRERVGSGHETRKTRAIRYYNMKGGDIGCFGVHTYTHAQATGDLWA